MHTWPSLCRELVRWLPVRAQRHLDAHHLLKCFLGTNDADAHAYVTDYIIYARIDESCMY